MLSKCFINGTKAKKRIFFTAILSAFGFFAIYAYITLLQLIIQPPQLFKRDLNQLYVAGKAIIAHVNPYLPTPKLTKLLLDVDEPVLPHPTPYPPPALFIGVFLALFSPQVAAVLWMGISMICLWFALGQIFKFVDLPKSPYAMLSCFLWAILSNFAYSDLYFGQNSMVFLLAISIVLNLIKSGRLVFAGSILGITFAAKFVTYPLILYIFVARKWKALMTCVVTVAIMNCFSLLLIGMENFVFYYTVATKKVSLLYSTALGNVSIFTILGKFLYPPLVSHDAKIWSTVKEGHAESLMIISSLIAITWLVLTIARSWNEPSSVRYARLVAFASVGMPIMWIHYQSLLIIPIAVAASYYLKKKINPYLYTLTVLTVFFISVDYSGFAFSLALPFDPGDAPTPASIPIILLSIVPTIVPLLWTIVPFESLSKSQEM